MFGDNVGISSTAIICHKGITIGDNVKIGGNVVIYDTDFHSLDVVERISIPEDISNVKTEEVIINNNVFIGAHTTILKGTVIGENSVIGAGSLVVGIIPPNVIAGGNPCKVIKSL